MKKIFFVLPLIFLCYCSQAQVTGEYQKQAKAFLEWNFRKSKPPIIIVGAIDTFTFRELKNLLATYTFSNHYTGVNGIAMRDSIYLSKDERSYIDSFFADIKNLTCNQKFVDNSINVPATTFDSLYQQHGDVSMYLFEHYKTDRYHRILQPVFLRNYTICIFYDAILKGMPLGDEAMIAIYKKVNNNWQLWRELAHWND